jgi:hypothetical protein
MYCDLYDEGPYVDVSNGVIRFDYESSDRQDHDQRIEDFKKMAEEFLKDFNRTDTDTERALLIYERLLASMKYDSSLDEEDAYLSKMMRSGYYAIVYGEGMSETFANAYCFLLAQTDVDAVTVYSVYSQNENVTHYWTAVNLDSNWYYADLSLDLDGRSMTHFGMIDAEMSDIGYSEAENEALTRYTGKHIKDLIDTLDSKFHVLHGGAYEAVLDRDADTVTFKDSNGSTVVFKLIEIKI